MPDFENFHVQEYLDTIEDLQQDTMTDIDLREHVETRAGKGRTLMLPSISLTDDDIAAYNADTDLQIEAKDKKTVAAFNRLADVAQTFEEYLKTRTQHSPVSKINTLITARTDSKSHVFEETDDIFEMVNPQSYTLRKLMEFLQARRNKMILSGIAAASVKRGRDESDNAVVNMPASQQVSMPIGEMDSTVFSRIRRTFGKTGVSMAMKAKCLISWEDWEKLFNNRGDVQINMNKDFVDPTEHYRQTGRYPTIANVEVMPWDQIAEDSFYAWCDKAVKYIDFGGGIKANIGPNPDANFQITAHMRRYDAAVRTDDKLVIHGTIAPVP